MVPPGRVDRGHRGGRRPRGRLDRDRGRTSAVGRLPDPANGRRRHSGPRRPGDVPGRRRAVHGARDHDARGSPQPRSAVGGPGCRRRRQGHRQRDRRRHPVRPARRLDRPTLMTAADLTAIVLWLGLTAYAVFGGADFGAGFWDLVAGGTRRGAAPRALIAEAIGPVWDPNHTGLIFDLLILCTAV